MKTMQMNSEKRFWELDFVRGAAIVMMVAYHFFYDLDFFGAFAIDKDSGFWWYFPRLIAAMFIGAAGASAALSDSRGRLHDPDITHTAACLKLLKRGLWIFFWGMGITLATWLFLGEDGGFVVFGILHFIGFSIVFAYPFLLLGQRLGFLNLALGAAFIFIGEWLKRFAFDFSWLVWLTPQNFYSVDYFPVFPWFGVFLIGIFLGNLLYGNYKRKIPIPELREIPLLRQVCFLGRHSLLVYLVHQPVLILLLYALGVADLGSLHLG